MLLYAHTFSGFYKRHFSHMFDNAFAVDRTGVYENIHNYYVQNVCPLPLDVPTDQIDLAELCYTRATELTHSSIPLAILWSGGIDSSLVVTSLLQANATFVIITTPKAVEEHPVMYNMLRKHPNVMIKSILHLVDLAKTHAILSGDLGDQLLTSNETRTAKIKEIPLDTPAQQGIERFYKAPGSLGISTKDIWTTISQTAKTQNVQLSTLMDALWWITFNFNWQGVKHRFYVNSAFDRSTSTVSPYLSFYDDYRFEQWAIQYNQRANAPDVISSKQIYLATIDKLGGSMPEGKKKIPSQGALWAGMMRPIAIDTNYRPIFTRSELYQFRKPEVK